MKNNIDTAKLNIYEKLAKIREMVEVLQKNKRGHGYMYVSEDEILAKITAGLKMYRVDFYPSINNQTLNVQPLCYLKTKVSPSGEIYEEHVNEILISSEMTFTWVDLDDISQKIYVPWILVGQQKDASQAFGGGLTYSNRYFLLKYFKASTTEADPDNWRSRQMEAEKENDIKSAKEINNMIDDIVHKNVTDENRAALTELIKANVHINGKASSNYMKIESPEVSAALLSKVREFFNIDN